MKILAINNPASGKKKLKQSDYQINNFKKSNLEIEYFETTIDNNATKILQNYESEPDVLVIFGGDGTISESIQGIHDKNFNSKVLIIPTGTTNEIASNLKISENINENIQILEGGNFDNLVDIDYGLINDEITFTYSFTFGTFTELTYKTPQKLKNILGYFAYILYGFFTFRKIYDYNMKFSVNNIEFEDNFTFGGITNTFTIGNIINLSQLEPKLNDGLFEVFLIRTPKNFKEYRNTIKSLRKNDFQNDRFLIFNTDRLTVKSKDEIKWNIDGEYGGSYTSLNVKNITNKIKIIK